MFLFTNTRKNLPLKPNSFETVNKFVKKTQPVWKYFIFYSFYHTRARHFIPWCQINHKIASLRRVTVTVLCCSFVSSENLISKWMYLWWHVTEKRFHAWVIATDNRKRSKMKYFLCLAYKWVFIRAIP